MISVYVIALKYLFVSSAYTEGMEEVDSGTEVDTTDPSPGMCVCSYLDESCKMCIHLAKHPLLLLKEAKPRIPCCVCV